MISKLRLNFSTIVLTIAILFLVVHLGNALFLYARHAVAAVGFPYPLDYGEGPILDQVLRLSKGETIYRSSFDVPPYTVTLTPPLYMLLQSPLVQIFGLSPGYGRAISILSLLIAAMFLGLTLFQLTRDHLASIIGGLLLFSVPYFFNWSVLDQVDSLALALSWAGLFSIVRWPDRWRGLTLAVLLFTGAIYTQQTYVLVAPATALAWLIQTRRLRQAIALLLTTVSLCLLLFLGINIFTGGGFAFNLSAFNVINPWLYPQVAGRLIEFTIHAFILFLITLFFLIAERLDAPTHSWPFVLPYVIAAFLITMSVGKAISSDNFMYELAAALCLTSGAAIAWVKNHWVRAAVLLLIGIQVGSFVAWTKADYQPIFDEKLSYRSEISRLSEMIRQTDSPILIDEYMGLIPLAGKNLYFQPFEFGQLEFSGLWNPAPLISDLKHHKFPVLMIYFRDYRITKSRWTTDIYAACWENYTLTQTLADTLVLSPDK